MKDILYFNNWLLANDQVLSYLESFKGRERMTYVSREDKGFRIIALATSDRMKEEYMVSNTQEYMTRLTIPSDDANDLLRFIYLSSKSSSHSV